MFALKVKWNVFWQGLDYIVLQQSPEKKKKTIYFTFDKRQKQNKSFQITFQLEILKKKMIRHYGLKL